MQRKSVGYALLNHKCPRCRTGDIFRYSLFQKPTKFTSTYKKCPHCGLQYEREPGFFFGAMYVSYALTMAVLLATAFILYNFFNDPEVTVYIITVPMVVILLLPVVFRYSRTLYLHGFGGVKYNPGLASKASSDNS
uniref:DUF983 domain-containing protein n=1 Tax=Roseihalotalea indica TaxID=2867963 RepID=A0AA49GRB5_9BACT|nr:DUF983 domain-containing protein [Tunicatimonas sp. TK19036]